MARGFRSIKNRAAKVANARVMLAAGKSRADIAKVLGVSVATIANWTFPVKPAKPRRRRGQAAPHMPRASRNGTPASLADVAAQATARAATLESEARQWRALARAAAQAGR